MEQDLAEKKKRGRAALSSNTDVGEPA